MSFKLRFVVYNSHSILIEWPAVINTKTLQDVLNYKNSIENFYSKQKVEVINTYSSLLIIYKYTIEDVNSAFLEVKELYDKENNVQHYKALVWKIPVCYDDEFGSDLNAFSREKKTK